MRKTKYHPSSDVPYLDAVWRSDRKGMQEAFEAGSGPNDVDSTGNTGIHQACLGSYEVMFLCFQHGADLHLRDRNGRTPMHKAQQNGYHVCVCALMALGVAPLTNSKTLDGRYEAVIAEVIQFNRVEAALHTRQADLLHWTLSQPEVASDREALLKGLERAERLKPSHGEEPIAMLRAVIARQEALAAVREALADDPRPGGSNT